MESLTIQTQENRTCTIKPNYVNNIQEPLGNANPAFTSDTQVNEPHALGMMMILNYIVFSLDKQIK